MRMPETACDQIDIYIYIYNIYVCVYIYCGYVLGLFGLDT